MSPSVAPHLDEGFPALYDELRSIARRALAGESPQHTLQPTALVHELYLRLGPDGAGTFLGRSHFLAVASAAMRRILVDHARARGRAKRGGGWQRVDLDDRLRLDDAGLDAALAVHEAIDRLGRTVDPRLATMVQMRFFGGMTVEEVAAEMEMSDRWVRKQWAFSRLWLRQALADEAV